MPIEWRDKLSVGNAVIDADHKALIGLINDFEADMARGLDHAGLTKTLKALFKYAKEHFAREETLQMRSGYPYYTAHAQEHRRLLTQAEQMARRYLGDPDAPLDAAAKDEMSAFLRDWLVGHIIQQDLRLMPYVKNM